MNRETSDRDAVAALAAAELARWSAYALTALLLAGAGTMACRRFADALQRPLEGLTLLLAGAVAAGAAAVARSLLRWPRPAGETPREDRALRWLVSLGLAAWGVALSLRGTHPAGLLLLWGVLIGEEAWVWRAALGRNWPWGDLKKDHQLQSPRDGAPGVGPTRPPRLLADPAAGRSGDVLQEFVRSREPGGVELLTGWMRVALAPGQRSTTVHLAFCPPFARTPTVAVAQQEGPAARIKESQVLPFGARLDVKLAQAADVPTAVLLEIAVRADSPNPAQDVQRPADG